MKHSANQSNMMFAICALLKLAAVIMLPQSQHEKCKSDNKCFCG